MLVAKRKICDVMRTISLLCLTVLVSVLLIPQARAGTVIIGSTPTGHLMWIAEELGYFKESGSDVLLKKFSSGVTTSQALASGEIHLANSSEFAFVNNVMHHRDLKLVASIAKTNSANIFGRKDRGITTAQDLIGKTIGVTRHGIGEFFLGEYLSLNGIALSDVTLVDLRPHEIVKHISYGSIDAAISWEPSVYKSAKALGSNFVRLPDQDSHYYHFVVAGQRDWLDSNTRDVQNVLRALIRAQHFAAENPADAQAIMAKRFKLDPVFVRDTWHKYILEVTLLQELLSLMEQEARWLLENDLIDVTGAPDFLDAISLEALTKVDANAVHIIR